MLTLLIVGPLAVVLSMNILPKRFIALLGWLIGLAGMLFQAALVLFCGRNPGFAQVNLFGKYLQCALTADAISFVTLLTIAIAGLITLLVARYFLKDQEGRYIFINLFFLAIAGLNGVVLTADIFTLYIFLEIASVASYILIVLNHRKTAQEAAFKYIVLSIVATTMMLCSITLILLFAGETSFASIRAAFNYSTHNILLMIAVSLFLGGVFIKGGIIPFHAWLPEAYSEAPAPVSVFLAGIVTKTLGVYTLIRIVNSIFGFNDNIGALLMFAGAVSIILAALGAIAQNDFKRVLAYSSISQMGYIVLALGAATPLGLAAAMFHFFNHSIFKMLLFINSAAVEEQTKTRNLTLLGGLAEKMPATGTASVIASLSAAGVPPLAGFWSKLLIVIALVVSGHPVYGAIAVLASILTLTYLLSIQHKVFFGPCEVSWQQVREAGWGLLVPAVILVLITVGVGIFFPVFLDAFVAPVQEAFGG